MSTKEYQIQGEHTTGLTAKHYHGESISTLNEWAKNNVPKNAIVSSIQVKYRGKISTGDTYFYVGFTNDSSKEPGYELINNQLSKSDNTWYGNITTFSSTYPFNISVSGYSLLNFWASSGIIMKKYTCYDFRVIWNYLIPVYTITLNSSDGGYAYTVVDGYNTTGPIQFENGSTVKINVRVTNSGYKFVKWSDGNTSAERTITVSANAAYTPVFERIKVTATFKNGDAVLQTSELFYGETPSYTGSTPAKNSTAQYHYSFSGWSKTIGAITADTVYEAQFTSTLREYQINLVCTPSESGDTIALIGAGTYKYGETITLRPEGIPPYHEFSHWLKYNGDTPTYIYSNPFITIVDEGLIGDGSETSVTLYCNFKHTGYNVRARILPESSMGVIELCKVSTDANGTKIYEKVDIIPNEGTVNIKYSERNGCYAFRAVPNAKYKFAKWNDDNAENPREIIVSNSSVKKYSAIFELDRINQILVDLSQSGVILVDLEEADKIYADEVKTYG